MKIYYLYILLLFSSAFSIGCTSTWIVAMHSIQTERDTITINQLEQKLHGKTVKIILRDSRKIQAENVTFSKDTATFTILPDLKQNAIPLVTIKKIEIRLYSDGTVVGGICGGLCGGIVGLIYLKLHPDNSNESFNVMFDDVMRDVCYPLVIGLFSGGIYGGIRGNIEEYIFNSDIDKHAP